MSLSLFWHAEQNVFLKHLLATGSGVFVLAENNSAKVTWFCDLITE